MREHSNKFNFRSKRGFQIADHIRKAVSEIVRAKVKDPRLKTITVTDVEITHDLSIAKIYYSVYPWSRTTLTELGLVWNLRENLSGCSWGKSLHVTEFQTLLSS